MIRSQVVAPLRVSPVQAALEAVCCFGVLFLVSIVLNGFGRAAGAPPAVAFVSLAWLALVLWPAWRTRVAAGRHWWNRMARGVAWGTVIVVLLTLGAVLVNGVVGGTIHAWPSSGFAPSKYPLVALVLAFGFWCVRVAILVAAWVVAKIQRRLRWQLMASHIAVIVLTFGALTSLGSILAIGVAIEGIRPDAAEMARSVRQDLELTGRPMDTAQAHRVFAAIMRGDLTPRGQPVFAFIVKGTGIPGGIALFDPNGRVLTGVRRREPLRAATWRNVVEITAPDWSQLRSAALRGQVVTVQTHVPGTQTQEQATLAEAPIRTSDGKTTGIVVLLAQGLNPTTQQFLQAVILLFGASTLILIVITSAPLVVLSFLFSYLVARGLTRRLEAVSHVAGAIASGNFSERATVRSQNEVGRLADDINQMAEHQERLVAELRAARFQAEEALRTRQRLIADVSHELRTPLAVLRAHLESLGAHASVVTARSRSPDVTVPAEALESLEGETLRLEALIEDLFALSRVQEGGLTVDISPIDVAAIVDDVATLMRPLARRESGIVLSTDVPPGLPPAMADPDRLRQILSNLVRNAIRHTPEGGIVVLSAGREGPNVAIVVADTGEGIEPEHLAHLFDRFFRADPSRTRETGGAGLGLAIVHELVELMDGSVSVESEPGQGSRFTVRLPSHSPGP